MKTSSVLSFLITLATAQPDPDTSWPDTYSKADVEDQGQFCPQDDIRSSNWKECHDNCVKRGRIMGYWFNVDKYPKPSSLTIKCWKKDDWDRKEKAEGRFIGGQPCDRSTKCLQYGLGERGEGYEISIGGGQGGMTRSNLTAILLGLQFVSKSSVSSLEAVRCG